VEAPGCGRYEKCGTYDQESQMQLSKPFGAYIMTLPQIQKRELQDFLFALLSFCLALVSFFLVILLFLPGGMEMFTLCHVGNT
jgi:hypothetical protein